MYRLSGEQGHYLADVMLLEDEAPPEVGRPYLCRHPFIPEHRVHIIPSRVDSGTYGRFSACAYNIVLASTFLT